MPRLALALPPPWPNVSASQPTLSAIEVIAAHREACWAWCSQTIRIARSRTSRENPLGLVMAHALKEWSLRETRSGSERP
jgi:hypothetical protein